MADGFQNVFPFGKFSERDFYFPCWSSRFEDYDQFINAISRARISLIFVSMRYHARRPKNHRRFTWQMIVPSIMIIIEIITIFKRASRKSALCFSTYRELLARIACLVCRALLQILAPCFHCSLKSRNFLILIIISHNFLIINKKNYCYQNNSDIHCNKLL